MRDWQPIETAPRDGARIMLTDGVRLAVGYRDSRIEDDWMFHGYEYDAHGEPFAGDKFLNRVPNPDAGVRREWWALIGCTAFSDDDTPYLDEDGKPAWFEPTHWMPLIPTVTQKTLAVPNR